MKTRRQFMKAIPVTGAAFAVTGTALLEGSAPASETPSAQPPLAGHFHPKGKAPSKYTKEILEQAKATLPFADERDFEEKDKGFIAPMKQMKIMADAGHAAWDMEAFSFLDENRDFDSIHPSLVRVSRLNQNYGLYEVIPGIYQVRGFDLSDITFIRGKKGYHREAIEGLQKRGFVRARVNGDIVDIREALSEGLRPQDAAKRAGAPPFKANDLTESARRFTAGSLGDAFALLAETDRALKGSKRPPDVILQNAVLELCADRR